VIRADIEALYNWHRIEARRKRIVVVSRFKKPEKEGVGALVAKAMGDIR
jgi:hypothetical protein